MSLVRSSESVGGEGKTAAILTFEATEKRKYIRMIIV